MTTEQDSDRSSIHSIESIERFLNDPNEAACFDDILNAANGTDIGTLAGPSQSPEQRPDFIPSVYQPENDITWEGRSTSGNSNNTSSGSSWVSNSSVGSQTGKIRRKGKRVYARPYPLKSPSRTAKLEERVPKRRQRKYCCTFCLTEFRGKWEWTRHETIHVPTRKWICLADNCPTVDDRCVFCNASSPTVEHLNQHSVAGCLQQAAENRTFTRKDHLVQHIRQVHLKSGKRGDKLDHRLARIVKSWVREIQTEEIDPSALWCGFCRTSFDDYGWQKRVDHVAEHFQQDRIIDDWFCRYWQCPSEFWNFWHIKESTDDDRSKCLQPYLSALSFREHLRTVHQEDSSWLVLEMLRSCMREMRLCEIGFLQYH